MRSNQFGATCFLIWSVVLLNFKRNVQAFEENRNKSPCQPGTFPSVNFGGDCVDCPEKCENEHYKDVESCNELCGKELSTSTPTTNQQRVVKLSQSAKAKPSKRDKITENKPTTRLEGSGLSESNRLALVFSVLAVFILLITAMVVWLWRKSRTAAMEAKSDEEEPVEICANADSSPCRSMTNVPESNQESEYLPESEKAQILDTRIRSTEYHSSDMNLKDTSF